MSKKTFMFRNTRDGLQEISTNLHNHFWGLAREFTIDWDGDRPERLPNWHLAHAEKLAKLTVLIRKIDDAHRALWNDFTPDGDLFGEFTPSLPRSPRSDDAE